MQEHNYPKYNKSVQFKLVDTILANTQMKNQNQMQLAINRVILITKMCLSKFKYGTYFSLLLLFEENWIRENYNLGKNLKKQELQLSK